MRKPQDTVQVPEEITKHPVTEQTKPVEKSSSEKSKTGILNMKDMLLFHRLTNNIEQLSFISCVGHNTLNLCTLEVTKPESKTKEAAKKQSDEDKPVMLKMSPPPGTGRDDHRPLNKTTSCLKAHPLYFLLYN